MSTSEYSRNKSSEQGKHDASFGSEDNLVLSDEPLTSPLCKTPDPSLSSPFSKSPISSPVQRTPESSPARSSSSSDEDGPPTKRKRYEFHTTNKVQHSHI